MTLGWIALFLLGCATTDDTTETTPAPATPGSLALSWRVGADDSCDVSGVNTIAVYLDDVATEPVAELACDTGSGTVPDVNAGSYTVILRGLDGEGDARYGGEAADVVVTGGVETDVPEVLLSALPAGIDVSWFFANGKLCSSNDAETMDVLVFDDSDFVIDQGTAACDDGLYSVTDLTAGGYQVQVTGKSSSGAENWYGEAGITLARGGQEQLDVQLDWIGTGTAP